MYKPLNFLTHKLPNSSIVVQNEVSTTIIDDAKLVEFLIHIDENRLKFLDNKIFENWFLDDSDNVISFLIENKLIVEDVQDYIIFDNIYILSDDVEIGELLYKAYSTKNINIKQINLNELLTVDTNHTKSLIITFLSEYNHEKSSSILEFTQSSDYIYLQLAYSYKHSVYFDCIYSTSIMTPCHECIKGIIDGQIFDEYDGPTYNQLLNMIYKVDHSFNIQYPLEFHHKIMIVNQINKQLQGLLPKNSEYISYKHHQDFTNIYKLDLRTNQIYQDNAIFWEMCDCYEKL